jgi:hypothetical protein
MTQSGLLLITDITGYSKYVNQSELEHAQSSLADLLRLLMDNTRSPLVLSKLEGDAVLSYAPYEGFLQPQTLVEMIESTYLAFRKALELMILNTTCTCAACRNLRDLDLKFFVHCGSFTIQELKQYHELLGNDVNLVHRLTKNHIKEKTGMGAYTAYTQAVIERMGLGQIAENMVPHRETFADVGEVQLYVQDMHTVWETRGKELRMRVEQNNMLAQLEFDFPYPSALIWQYITDPRFRAVINGSESQQLVDLFAGRTGIGSAYVCVHGSSRFRQSIVDWEPLEQYTTTDQVMGSQLLTTLHVVPAGDGTRLQLRVGLSQAAPMTFVIFKYLLGPFYVRMKKAAFAELRQRIDQDMSERGSLMPAENRVNEQALAAAVANGNRHREGDD